MNILDVLPEVFGDGLTAYQHMLEHCRLVMEMWYSSIVKLPNDSCWLCNDDDDDDDGGSDDEFLEPCWNTYVSLLHFHTYVADIPNEDHPHSLMMQMSVTQGSEFSILHSSFCAVYLWTTTLCRWWVTVFLLFSSITLPFKHYSLTEHYNRDTTLPLYSHLFQYWIFPFCTHTTCKTDGQITKQHALTSQTRFIFSECLTFLSYFTVLKFVYSDTRKLHCIRHLLDLKSASTISASFVHSVTNVFTVFYVYNFHVFVVMILCRNLMKYRQLNGGMLLLWKQRREYIFAQLCLPICWCCRSVSCLAVHLSILTAENSVSILDFIGAKDDRSGDDNLNYKSCKAPVESSPPTNQHPTFYRPEVLPDAQPTE